VKLTCHGFIDTGRSWWVHGLNAITKQVVGASPEQVFLFSSNFHMEDADDNPGNTKHTQWVWAAGKKL
jgi:hypothetical protein